MKRTHFLISGLLLFTTCFLSNGFAQNYVYHATLAGYEYVGKNTVFSPDSRMLASSGGWDKTILIWDAEAGVHLRAFTGPTGAVTSVSFSPDGRTLACASMGGIFLFNTATGKLKKELSEHISNWAFGAATRILFSPDGRTLVVCPV